MMRSIVIGLGLAGVAYWLGQRAGAEVKEVVGGGAPGGAHNVDGSDASSAFRAGIADENMIPNPA